MNKTIEADDYLSAFFILEDEEQPDLIPELILFAENVVIYEVWRLALSYSVDLILDPKFVLELLTIKNVKDRFYSLEAVAVLHNSYVETKQAQKTN